MVEPGCTKRLPASDSIRPAAIRSNVDLPEPLRPIRQTRSSAETLSSTPVSSGVPPKVSAMSLSWITGDARSHALDQRVVRDADEFARDDADRQPMAGRDAVDFVLHRAGVGIDIDAGMGLGHCWRRGTPSRLQLRAKPHAWNALAPRDSSR